MRIYLTYWTEGALGRVLQGADFGRQVAPKRLRSKEEDMTETIDSCPGCGSKKSGNAVAWCKRCEKYMCVDCMDGLTPEGDPYTSGYYYCEAHGPNAQHWYREDFIRIS